MRSARRPSGGFCGLLLTSGIAPEIASDLAIEFLQLTIYPTEGEGKYCKYRQAMEPRTYR